MIGRAHSVRMDALRGTAALLVVAGHTRALVACDWLAVPERGGLAGAFYSLTHLGTQAVAAFFVLSGYWVGGHLLKTFRLGEFAWALYLIQRITRLIIVLLPALALTTVAMVCARTIFKNAAIFHDAALSSSVIPPIGAASWQAESIIGSALFLQPTLSTVPALNGPLWTLGLEFWCYLLAPILLHIWTGRRLMLWFAAAAASIFMISAGGPEYPLLWAIGALVAQFPTRGICMNLVVHDRARLAISSLVLWVAVIASAVPSMPSFISLFVVGIATADFIASSASVKDHSVKSRALRLAAWIGGRSYSLYLIHLPLLVTAVAAMYQFLDFERTDKLYLAVGLNLLGLAGSVLVASVFFAIFEARTSELRSFLAARLSVSPQTRSGRARA